MKVAAIQHVFDDIAQAAHPYIPEQLHHFRLEDNWLPSNILVPSSVRGILESKSQGDIHQPELAIIYRAIALVYRFGEVVATSAVITLDVHMYARVRACA